MVDRGPYPRVKRSRELNRSASLQACRDYPILPLNHHQNYTFFSPAKRLIVSAIFFIPLKGFQHLNKREFFFFLYLYSFRFGRRKREKNKTMTSLFHTRFYTVNVHIIRIRYYTCNVKICIC